MRILHCITDLSTGGAEQALYNVVAGGLGSHHETAVISLQGEGSLGGPIRGLGVAVYTLGMRSGWPSLRGLIRLRRVVEVVQPDIVQGWMYHGNVAASLAARLSGCGPAVAWNVRQSLYNLSREKLLTRQVVRANRAMSANASLIIYNSHLSRHQHEAFGFERSRAQVVPNGFDLERVRPDEAMGSAVRAEMGFPVAAPVVGHVARFHPMKDHASFLRAAVRVAQKDPQARFLLIGREVSLDQPSLKGIVPPEFLERFVFTGERSDAQRLMQSMDVLAASSAWGEAFPNVLGEAMACGVPCVTTDVGDSAAIVGDSGIVVPPSDPEALANGLQALLKKRDEERRALGRSARARIESHFSLPSVVERYADLYGNLA